jgi:hypothetical protein
MRGVPIRSSLPEFWVPVPIVSLAKIDTLVGHFSDDAPDLTAVSKSRRIVDPTDTPMEIIVVGVAITSALLNKDQTE